MPSFLTKCANIPYKEYSWLKDHCCRTLKRPCSPNVRNEHLAILDLIKEHEEGQWVPVSKRLPEQYKEVIVTDIGTSDTYLSRYIGNGYWECDNGSFKNRIIAWQPKPKPYKIESEDEE